MGEINPRKYFGAVAVGDRIFMLGGSNDTHLLDSVSYYDVSEASETTLGLTMVDAIAHCTATQAGGDLLCTFGGTSSGPVGGWPVTGTPSDSGYIHCLSTSNLDSWAFTSDSEPQAERVAPLVEYLEDIARVAVVGGIITTPNSSVTFEEERRATRRVALFDPANHHPAHGFQKTRRGRSCRRPCPRPCSLLDTAGQP